MLLILIGIFIFFSNGITLPTKFGNHYNFEGFSLSVLALSPMVIGLTLFNCKVEVGGRVTSRKCILGIIIGFALLAYSVQFSTLLPNN